MLSNTKTSCTKGNCTFASPKEDIDWYGRSGRKNRYAKVYFDSKERFLEDK